MSIIPLPFGLFTVASPRYAVRRIGLGDMGRAAPDVQQLIHNAVASGLSLDFLYGAEQSNGGIIAAALLVPQAGRTGLLFLSRSRRRVVSEALVGLVEACCTRAPRERVTLAQALLSPGDTAAGVVLERAGFWILTDLAYMQAAVPRVPPAGQSPVGLELCHWQPALADTFRQLLDASYEQTLDCPRLKGLRDTRDVIAGHRAVGLFEPELWTMASLDGQPAAAMLLNHVPTSGCVELVYLGVCPAFRRRGLAKALLQHALRQCAQRRIAHVTLAVDIHNAPALELYQGAGFYRTASKRVMMRLLTAKPGADRP